MDECTCDAAGYGDDDHLVGCPQFQCPTCGGRVEHRAGCADDGSETCWICDQPPAACVCTDADSASPDVPGPGGISGLA